MSQYRNYHPHHMESAHTNAIMGPVNPSQGEYPGLQPMHPGPFGQNYPMPYQHPGTLGATGNKFNWNDLKAFVDKMGGIEGIMSSLNKMNSIIQNVQKMAPMIRLLASTFAAKKTASTNELELSIPHRPPRKKKRTSSHKRKRSQNLKKRRTKSKKIRSK